MTAIELPPVIMTAYPRTTHVRIQTPAFEPRRFQILGVRDLVHQPLTIDEFIRRPMTRRSRYLLRVRDLDRGLVRNIYHRSMLDFYRETPIRVGIFEGDRLLELLSTNWGPTIQDRLGLIKFLLRFRDQDLGQCRLGVFSDDLEVIS